MLLRLLRAGVASVSSRSNCHCGSSCSVRFEKQLYHRGLTAIDLKDAEEGCDDDEEQEQEQEQ